jgi:nicotinamide riboside transporter PnuC
MVLNVVKSRDGWELYIVTDGVMVGLLLGEGALHTVILVFYSSNMIKK